MLRREKEQVVAELAERLKSTDTLIVADYRGLTVTEIGELRDKLVEAGARFSVVKNTLTRIAAEQAGTKELLELVDGPTAIAFIEEDGDPVAAAKVLSDVARVGRLLVIRGGLLDGEPISEADVANLSRLPPADVLRAQFVGTLAGSLTTVVGLFTAPLRDLVGVLDARIEQLEETGQRGAEADASAPAEEPEVTGETPEKPEKDEESETTEEEQEDGN